MNKRTSALILFVLFAAALAEVSYGEFLPFSFPKNETIIFENNSGSDKATMVTNTYYPDKKNFVIKQIEGNGSVTKILVDKNFKPISYKKVSRTGSMLEYAGYSKGKMTIKIPAKKLNKTVNLPSTYYDAFTFFYTFRKYPVGKKDSVYINVAYHDPGNVRVVKMQVKYKGIEEVKVKAGTFKCHRFEMGTCNPLDVAVWPYKYNFWFTADQNRHFVKFSGRERDSSTITSEIAVYKIGSKSVVKRSDMNSGKSGSSALLINGNI